MLTVPTGAIFNGIVASGGMGTVWPDIALQAVHQKPIFGGYLGRLPRKTYDAIAGDEFFQALLRAQTDGTIAPVLADSARVAAYLRRMRFRYVLLNAAKMPATLSAAVSRWPTRKIDAEDGVELYSFEP